MSIEGGILPKILRLYLKNKGIEWINDGPKGRYALEFSPEAGGSDLWQLNPPIEDRALICEALGRLVPGFGDFPNQEYLPKELGILPPIDQEWIFYGGSFNPWHKGHLECVAQVRKECPSSGIIIVPDANPWKEGFVQEPFSLLKTLAREVLPLNCFIYPGFLNKESNPTWPWFQKIPWQKSLLIGDDNFLKFSEWEGYEEILKECRHLYVVPRNRSRDELLTIKKSFPFSDRIKILDEHPYKNLSSTIIRETKNSKSHK